MTKLVEKLINRACNCDSRLNLVCQGAIIDYIT